MTASLPARLVAFLTPAVEPSASPEPSVSLELSKLEASQALRASQALLKLQALQKTPDPLEPQARRVAPSGPVLTIGPSRQSATHAWLLRLTCR